MRKRATETARQEDHEHPRGTLILLLVYLVIIIGLWGSVFLILLERR